MIDYGNCSKERWHIVFLILCQFHLLIYIFTSLLGALLETSYSMALIGISMARTSGRSFIVRTF